MKLKFFTYSQNNSGGSYRIDKDAGLAHYVIIQARNIAEANALAESMGVYFNGVSDGVDCECCGDRWDEQWDEKDGTNTPEVYSKSIKSYLKDSWLDDCTVSVRYYDGMREWYFKAPKTQKLN